ncbi:MAG TPA: carboxypeptidase regulatory-like domain-containing protein, partial [Fimbriiglobus sp.]|nr:carboxypeptidase regulatory-like domain-containing protein [Fimbriiglobus sp.]
DTGTERPRLEFHRAAEGEPEVPTAGKTTSREMTKTYRVGEAGELLFRAEVKDWVVPLDTAGVYGTRKLEFSLTDEKGNVLTSPRIDNPNEREPVRDVHEFTLDDTVPAGVQLLALPPKVVPKKPRKLPPPGVPLPGPSPVPGLVLPPWACECVLPPSFGVPVPPPAVVVPKEVPLPLPLVLGKTRVRGTVIELIARAEDPESGIARALLFVGAPPGPDGKSPPGSQHAVAALTYRPLKAKEKGPPEALGYAATFTLPDVKGPLTVGVRFTNGAGLTTEVTHDLLLVDPPPPPTTGTIEGRVVQGSTPERPQPGLDVLLTDPAGKVVKAAKADAAGAFKFEELPPGPYSVATVKAADLGARAIQPATVEAGEVTTVTLELKR